MINIDAIFFNAVEYVVKLVLVPNIPMLLILKITPGDQIALDGRYINNSTA